jgi:hypothetical protein
MPARPATKVRKQRTEAPKIPPLKLPDERSLRAAALLADRLKHRPGRVRLQFVRNDEGVTGPPPLARFLRGGRGGEVRLKLYLSLLWAAGGGDARHRSTYPARSWAALLDLRDPEGLGQRRIRDAIDWLEEREFIKTEHQPGKPTAIQLLREDGAGRGYTDPGDAQKRKSGKAKQAEYHVTLPDSFWTDGWIVMLSARAVAMLLVISAVTFSEKEWEWVSPRVARSRYGISEDTWSRGIAELKARKIIEIRRRPVAVDDFDFRRLRNEYRVIRDKSWRIVFPAPPKP